ncbi:predicted protein [Uncinocarpus reesii 1704]|uniref:Indole-diterpene biosynthesis protein PaxU n=1 Tax=Uncinocarpus reesii (strain UAMH 1704) TaxID=336963 RepID=C4JG96_UNCRE|nr:uncharacterized protein UREG_02494 [Uncinocarpus reesii 1704]EEP77645.1 predicted protein [Uncinocarpus reesii 1704]
MPTAKPNSEVKFYHLSTGVTISSPSRNTPLPVHGKSRKKTKGPELVLLVTWMAAQPQQVARYSSVYRARYPNATIIHISCTVLDMVLFPASRKRRDLGPVVDIIQALSEEDAPDASDISDIPDKSKKRQPRILLHLFSGAGAYASSQLARAYNEKSKTYLPIDAMVLDSTPGAGSYTRRLQAIKSSMSCAPEMVQMIGGLFAHLFLICMWIVQWFGVGDMITRARQDLNNGTLIDNRAPRVYMYSKEDTMVRSEDIEAHAFEMQLNGGQVQKELFHGTGHVAHVDSFGKRYWKAVDKAWKQLEKRTP